MMKDEIEMKTLYEIKEILRMVEEHFRKQCKEYEMDPTIADFYYNPLTNRGIIETSFEHYDEYFCLETAEMGIGANGFEIVFW